MTWLRLSPLMVAEWRHHPWRHLVAVLAVALGVALAWSVHLINGSALSEFSAAVRSANGEPDAHIYSSKELLANPTACSLNDEVIVRVRTEVKTARIVA